MNLVFDLGGVVFTWEPEQLIQKIFSDYNARQRVREDIFQHADWAELDRGTLDREEAIQGAILRTGLPTADVEALLYRIPDLLVPIPETLNLLQHLKDKTSHKLFVLSNMHLASIHYIEQMYSFWDLFDGIVISGVVGMIKPEPEIFRLILDRYDLYAPETLYLDDNPENILAARRQGIQSVHFEKNPVSIEKIRSVWL